MDPGRHRRARRLGRIPESVPRCLVRRRQTLGVRWLWLHGSEGRPCAWLRSDHDVTDFLGGGENVRVKDFMAIHQRPEIFWAAMVLDGMFERFPGLRGASVEEGALGVVPWIRRLDRAMQVQRFEATMDAVSETVMQRFYSSNFADPYRGEVPL